jgi:glycine cleavage system H lipoate-binding protein
VTAILVVLTIILFASIDVLVRARRRRMGLPAEPVVLQPMRPPQPPYGVFLHPSHSWVRLLGDGSLRVGIDDFLAEALGTVLAVSVPAEGTKVRRGEPLLTLQLPTHRLVVRAPIDGEVVTVNQKVVADPAAITQDPYGLGWVASLWTRDHKEAISPLHLGNGAAAFLMQEFQRLVDFLTATGSPTAAPQLANGGLPLRGVVSALQQSDFDAFQRQFIDGWRAPQAPRIVK